MSPEGRIRTGVYQRNGSKFCLVETTLKGTLITEFGLDCQVTGQKYIEDTNQWKELEAYLDGYSISVTEVGQYNSIVMNAECSKCGNLGLKRELDIIPPRSISDVPVLPIFVCVRCSQKHFSLTDEYLRNLVSTNRDLFEQEELKEIDGDPEAKINTIKEYIIRIFASKKISRAKIK